MSKCLGCGARLQTDDQSKVGFAPSLDHKICQRCFKITHYHENKEAIKSKSDEDIILKINKKNYFTLFLVDIFNLNIRTIDLYNQIKTDKALVITKVDVLPKNMDFNQLKAKIKKIYDINDLYFFSRVSGYGQREILTLCEEKGKVILAGPTSGGKSSLINYLFKQKLTVSENKNTTYDFISIHYKDLLILDAPGFSDMYPLKESKLKARVNPKTLVLKPGYSLYIDDYIIGCPKEVSLTLYFPDNIFIKTKKEDINLTSMTIKSKHDLVLYSLGFIYFKKESAIMINKKISTEIRESVVVS